MGTGDRSPWTPDRWDNAGVGLPGWVDRFLQEVVLAAGSFWNGKPGPLTCRESRGEFRRLELRLQSCLARLLNHGEDNTSSLLSASLCRYLLGRILTGSSEPEAAPAPRRLRRSVDQDLGPEVPPENVLGALLRVKRLENPSPQAPARRLLPP